MGLLSMVILGLATAQPAAAAGCSLTADVRVRASGSRRDRLAFVVPEDDDACRDLALSVAERAPDRLRGVVRTADGRRFAVEEDRLELRWSGEAFVPRLLLPELQQGDAVELVLDWDDPTVRWTAAEGEEVEWLRVRGAGVDLPGGAPPAGPVVLGAEAVEGPGVPPGRRPDSGTLALELSLEPAPGGSWSSREPPAGRSTWRYSRLLRPGEQVGVPWPRDSQDRRCEGSTAVSLPDGCVLTAPAGESAEVRWGWTLPGMPVAGVIRAGEPGGSVPGDGLSLAVRLPEGRVLAQPRGGPLREGSGEVRVGVEGVGAVRLEPLPDSGLTRAAPAAIAWRVARLQGRGLLEDRDDLLQVVAWSALQASLPEPGLLAAFKGRKHEAALAEDVLAWLEISTRALPLDGAPERSELLPRPLMDVRRSGMGSPWERSLLLARYLRQLKLDATPVPVRGPDEAGWDPAMPVGYTAAVVRVEDADGEVRWLQPGCPDCALDRPRAQLGGALALAAGIERLPPAHPARQELVLDATTGQARLTLDGAPARQLRTSLLELEPGERAGVLKAALGGDRLLAHDGLRAPHQQVTVEVGGVALPRRSGSAARAADARVLGVELVEGARWLWPWPGTTLVRRTGLERALLPCTLAVRAGGSVLHHRQGTDAAGGWLERELVRDSVAESDELATLAEALGSMEQACSAPVGPRPG
jgi:hypothetical protein